MKLCMGCMNQMEDHLLVCPHCGFNEAALRQESYYLDPGTIIGGKYIVGRVMAGIRFPIWGWMQKRIER